MRPPAGEPYRRIDPIPPKQPSGSDRRTRRHCGFRLLSSGVTRKLDPSQINADQREPA